MENPSLHQDLLSAFDQLSPEAQQLALGTVKSWTRGQSGIAGKELLRFAGTITPEDCHAMEAAIEAACEQIDAHDW